MTDMDRQKYLEKESHQTVMHLFREASKRVPAYKEFLRESNIDPQKIRTVDDFKLIPPVDKKNYLSQYSLADLSWDGNIFSSRIISVSSGSSGVPFFWPRSKAQDLEGGLMHEELYREVFEVKKYTTLIVICFSMGTWIAGSFTTASSLYVADQGYKINIVTPGIDKDEAVKVIKQLSPLYDQIIVAGYPPFVKDVIDLGASEGIDWQKTRTRFLWAGESFSEEWRDYVLSTAGSNNPYWDSVSIYGSADASMMGHETPVSILVRKILNDKPGLLEGQFKTNILPSIVQFYPNRRYFEEVDGEIVLSAYAGIPLLRYNIHDSGGVVQYTDMISPMRDELIDRAKKLKIPLDKWQLPFVYLKGRKDFTVTIYAVNIYPENIKSATMDKKLRDSLTGKFTMATKYYSNMNQYFEINVELKKDEAASAELSERVKNCIIEHLKKLNAEYAKLYSAVGKKADPHIHLVEHGNQDYFGNGVKHRWVKK